MEVLYKDQLHSISEENQTQIEYFDIKTPKVTTPDGDEVYWCPFNWDWRSINHKDQMEKRYNNCLKTIYFNDKLFLVEKKMMRKHFKNKKLVDVCLLPIDMYVYWDDDNNQWEFLNYK